MAAVVALKFCEAIRSRGWGLMDMENAVGRLALEYCIAFGSIIGPMFEEITVDSKVGRTDCTARRQLTHGTTDDNQRMNQRGERVDHRLEVGLLQNRRR